MVSRIVCCPRNLRMSEPARALHQFFSTRYLWYSSSGSFIRINHYGRFEEYLNWFSTLKLIGVRKRQCSPDYAIRNLNNTKRAGLKPGSDSVSSTWSSSWLRRSRVKLVDLAKGPIGLRLGTLLQFSLCFFWLRKHITRTNRRKIYYKWRTSFWD